MSSVAACAFPPSGSVINEDSPPDGEHIYAVTKRIGEQMLAEYDGLIKTCIVRFAALFSDWCEYPPLYFFLQTWLSRVWNSRIIAGRGVSAIPYLHVRDAVVFLGRVLVKLPTLKQAELFQASPDGATTHLDLYDLTNLGFRGYRRKAIFMPRILCRVGVWGRDLLGRILGDRPFERPWMVRYIDDSLAVDASRTRRILGWQPRDRLLIERRVPFLAENLKTDPEEWHRRNREAMKEVRIRTNLRIYRLLEKHHDWIGRQLIRSLRGPEGKSRFPSYQHVQGDVLEWRGTVILRHLANAVRTQDKGIFKSYCQDLARRRFKEGFSADEVCDAIETLNNICLRRILDDAEGEGLGVALEHHVTMTIQFGCDQVYETFDQLTGFAGELAN